MPQRRRLRAPEIVKPLGDGVFNPLDRLTLAENISDHLLKRQLMPLPPDRFRGAGIYAIYYVGDYPLYKKLALSITSGENAIPLYVGKAIPPGSRKGALRLNANPGTALHKRLCDHRDSIKTTRDLKIEDFRCRYLLLDDVWIPLGESLLIYKFRPVWNICVDGFGSHHQGGTRTTQKKSAWDTLHPGRGWADHVTGENIKTAQLITDAIAAHIDRFISDNSN